jgi:hypothetical protein
MSASSNKNNASLVTPSSSNAAKVAKKNVAANVSRFSLIATAMLLLVAQAPTDDLSASEDAMTSCYIASAAYYGASSCQPPSKIIGAVFESCIIEETAYKATVQRSHPDDLDFPDDVLNKVRSNIATRLETAISNEQIKIQKCP